MLRRKMAAPGKDATTKRSRRVVPREVSENSRPEVLSSFRPAGSGVADEVGLGESGDVIEVEKGRHENAALSLQL